MLKLIPAIFKVKRMEIEQTLLKPQEKVRASKLELCEGLLLQSDLTLNERDEECIKRVERRISSLQVAVLTLKVRWIMLLIFRIMVLCQMPR